MMFYILSYALLLVWPSWEDIKHLRIPILGVFLIAMVSLLEVRQSSSLFLIEQMGIGMGVYGGLQILLYLLQHFLKEPGIGQGDVCLISILAMALPLEQLPYFILGIGMGGWIWGIGWKVRTGKTQFPMVPAIGMAFGIVRILL